MKLAITLAVAGAVLASAAPALAQSQTAQTIQNAYGNTTNPRPGGNGVLPSLAPGPWACANSSDCSDGVYAGGSVGEWRQDLRDDGQLNDSTDRGSFANRDDRDVGSPGNPVDHPDFAD